MSRSEKKHKIFKDKGLKELYWRIIRSHIKNIIRSTKDLEELELPSPKSILNDYDYCDYWFDCEKDSECRCMAKYGFKKCMNK